MAGVIAIDTRVALVTVNLVEPDTPANVAMIVLSPTASEVANPLESFALLTAATPELAELHVTEVVRSCGGPAENIPVAVNCVVVPSAMLGLVGVTSIETSVALVTVNWVEPETLATVAVIVLLPAEMDVANPALLIVATPVLVELHVAKFVRSCGVPSENIPVAVNCVVVPCAMLELVGVTSMDTSVALVTVNPVVPEILPSTALILLLPTVTEVANPELLMVATPVLTELQVTEDEISCFVWSEYIPVAMNCAVVPTAMLGLAGVTSMDTKVTPAPGTSGSLSVKQAERDNVAINTANHILGVFKFITFSFFVR